MQVNKVDDYRVSILILFMQHEVAVTINTLNILFCSVGEKVSISVLLNGGENSSLKSLCAKRKSVYYYESTNNLGVAGGRNFLLQTHECRNSEIVIVLDNDIIPPYDYIRNLATFLMNTENAGVVGGIAADINYFGLSSIATKNAKKNHGKDSVWLLTCAEIKEMVLTNFQPECIYHMGTHSDYYYAYFSTKRRLMSLIDRIRSIFNLHKIHHHNLKYNDALREQISMGLESFAVSNVAGCTQAFRRSLVDTIGPLNDLFNPYGFEDADFCIRSIKAGYTNYIDTNTWLFHGTDERHSQRSVEMKYYILFRGLTILSRLHFAKIKSRWIISNLLITEMLYALLSREGRKLSNYKAMVKGVKDGLTIVSKRNHKSNNLNRHKVDNET